MPFLIGGNSKNPPNFVGAVQVADEPKVPRPSENEVAVTLIDPITGERRQIKVEKSAKNRTRIKPGVNKFEVKRWIQQICPISYPAI